MRLLEKKKGIGVVKMVLAVTALMISLIGISVTLTLVNSLTQTTAVGDDSDSLEKLSSKIRGKCGALGEDISKGETPSISFEMSYAKTVKPKSGKLLMSFPESKNRDATLPDSCQVKFAEDEGGKLETGSYTLNIKGDSSTDPPTVTVSVKEKSGSGSK